MKVIVDGKEALIKKGSSFDFVSENRLFSGSDSFSLNIAFPIRGCAQNRKIFGNVFRPDVDPKSIEFDCSIEDKKFRRSGSLTITEISDSELKAQFLEGWSVRNFKKDLDDIYINEIPMGSFYSSATPNMSMSSHWIFHENPTLRPLVQWVSGDSGQKHNFAVYDTTNKLFQLDPEMKDLTYFRYLLEVTEDILEYCFSSVDLYEWRAHQFLRYLLVCNMLPGSWEVDNYARVLPHWTVAEFIEKLEVFLHGEFDVDFAASSVTFHFSKNVLAELPSVSVDNVLDGFSCAVKKDGSDCNFIDSSSLQFREESHQLANIYSCPWLLKDIPAGRLMTFETMSDLLDRFSSVINQGLHDLFDPRDKNLDKVMYVKDIDMYFIFRLVERIADKSLWNAYNRNLYALTPVNEFAPRLMSESDDEDAEDVDFVPACIDYTDKDHGYALFVNFGSFDETDKEEPTVDDSDYRTLTQIKLENGKKEATDEYFSSISVAFWDGSVPMFGGPFIPMPRVSRFAFWVPMAKTSDALPSTMPAVSAYGLSLDNPSIQEWKPLCSVDRSRRFKFCFLSDDIPDVRAFFFIRGKKFLCEKITATFTESGMSQLLKGEFWQVLEDD